MTELILPIVTPFKHDALHLKSFLHNLECYQAIGGRGFLVGGSSGEAALLEDSEVIDLWRVTRSALPSDCYLLAGIRHESNQGALKRIEHAAECGFDAALILPPHFHPLTPDALFDYFSRLSDRSPLPLMLYHVPKFTHQVLPHDLIQRISQLAQVVAIKESSTDLNHFTRTCALSNANFKVYGGHAPLIFEAKSKQAHGVILAIGNVALDLIQRAWNADQANKDQQTALLEPIQILTEKVLQQHGLGGLKFMMTLRGLKGGETRAPIPMPTVEAQQELEQLLETLLEQGAFLERLLCPSNPSP